MQSSSDSTVHRKRRVATTDKLLEESPPALKLPPRKIGPEPDLNQLYSDNWSWRRNKDISANYVQHLCPKTVFFHPNYSHGTAAAIGNRKLTKEIVAYWEVHVEFVYGTAMMFGIGKDSSKLLSPILFETLIGGEDANSYGLSHKGYLYHDGLVRQYCESARERQPVVVGVLFDGPRRELSYFVDGIYTGVAFENLALDNSTYYPMISSTSQKSKFTVAQQRCQKIISPLFELCMNTLLERVQINNIRELGLPENLVTILESRLNPQKLPTEKRASNKRQCLDKNEDRMEFDIVEPIVTNELNYDLISSLPPTIGEQLMRILWARAMPSKL